MSEDVHREEAWKGPDPSGARGDSGSRLFSPDLRKRCDGVTCMDRDPAASHAAGPPGTSPGPGVGACLAQPPWVSVLTSGRSCMFHHFVQTRT